MIVIGTGAEVEDRTNIEVAVDIATEGVIRVEVTVAMIIPDGRLPRALPALGLIHLTTPAGLPLNALLHRVVHLALPLDSTLPEIQIIHDHRPPVIGMPIHLDL